MKIQSFLAVAFFLAAAQAHATGGFYCEDKTGLGVGAGTGHVVGNPLIGDIFVSYQSGTQAKISRDRVVGYWNHRDSLKILATDAEYLETAMELDVSFAKPTSDGAGIGKLTLKVPTAYGKVIQRKATPVKCWTE